MKETTHTHIDMDEFDIIQMLNDDLDVVDDVNDNNNNKKEESWILTQPKKIGKNNKKKMWQSINP